MTPLPLHKPLDAGRRAFIASAMAGFGPALSTPSWSPTAGAATDFWRRPRQLVLVHRSSKEHIDATYWSDGQLVVSEYERLSYFMGDRTTNSGVYMHPVLLDILYAIGGWLRYFDLKEPIQLNSGYRDPKRNLTIEGAARTSRHIKGEAADISIPGVSPLQVARFSVWLGGGGVGWYPDKGFTHVDSGGLRTWRG